MITLDFFDKIRFITTKVSLLDERRNISFPLNIFQISYNLNKKNERKKRKRRLRRRGREKTYNLLRMLLVLVKKNFTTALLSNISTLLYNNVFLRAVLDTLKTFLNSLQFLIVSNTYTLQLLCTIKHKRNLTFVFSLIALCKSLRRKNTIQTFCSCKFNCFEQKSISIKIRGETLQNVIMY